MTGEPHVSCDAKVEKGEISPIQSIANLPTEDLSRFTSIALGHLLIHYGLWFAETASQLNPDKAEEVEETVRHRYWPAAVKRLGPHLAPATGLGEENFSSPANRPRLLELIQDAAKTWVMEDGLWFQAIESRFGMVQAKSINDAVWALFARFEAHKIRRFLKLPPDGGLTALEQALPLRLYSLINHHITTWNSDGSLVFTMTSCRVQEARRRKGMAGYPCKSAGMVEYTEFASSIDARLVTECVYCPPDDLPEDAFCAWKFSFTLATTNKHSEIQRL